MSSYLCFKQPGQTVIARSVSDEAIRLSFIAASSWIASWSLSSGANSRDPLARNDGKTQLRHLDTTSRSRRAFRASCCRELPALQSEGAGKAGCRSHPWVPCNKKHGGRTTGSTGITPAFPAQWFTAYFALSPVTGLSCHCRQRDAKHHRQLDASVGASGPHDFAVRRSGALVRSAIRVHRIPPRVRDDRETPLCRSGTELKIFLSLAGGQEKIRKIRN